jgi:hypothetical protein
VDYIGLASDKEVNFELTTLDLHIPIAECQLTCYFVLSFTVVTVLIITWNYLLQLNNTSIC